MPLAAGARLGPYEVLSPLGAGGMGEVYRARDPRLGREVAVKVVAGEEAPSPDRLRRFEQEARAVAALKHPHILAVHDVGSHEGRPYVVFELLEGETLRERLSRGPLPFSKAIELGVQTAQGLAAAHARGVVHRDLKPENLFLARDGGAKVLDFGLAKLRESPDDGSEVPTATTTEAGRWVGTPGYISPEQLRGEHADERSDVFALGAVLYEMLTGRRAFKGASREDTLSAILGRDAPAMTTPGGPVPLPLERVVRRCLEKDPEDRFQSARDVAFALDAVSGSTAGATVPGPIPLTPARRLLRAAPLLAGAALVAIGIAAGWRLFERSPPTFQPLTFRRGWIEYARFAPDGRTVVYAAGWEGRPLELFQTRTDSPESRALGLSHANVLAVSSQGQMAIIVDPDPAHSGYVSMGTLAVTPVNGAAPPRELLTGVTGADWMPDGRDLCVSHGSGSTATIELPPGNAIYRPHGATFFLRVSPDGRYAAFLDSGTNSIVALDLARRSTRTLVEGLSPNLWGMAWAPSSQELWFTYGSARPDAKDILAVDLEGRRRLVYRSPGDLSILDIAPSGRALLHRSVCRTSVMASFGEDAPAQDVSVANSSWLPTMSADGRTLLMCEGAFDTYLRRVGSEPVRLGEGEPMDLSPNGSSALVIRDRHLEVVSTGPGLPRSLDLGAIIPEKARFIPPDGRRVVVLGRERDSESMRFWVADASGGKPRALDGSPPQLMDDRCFGVSPDGRFVAMVNEPQGTVGLLPLDGGPTRDVGQVPAGLCVRRWSGDGQSIFLARLGPYVSCQLTRFSLSSGRLDVLRDVAPPDKAGVEGCWDSVTSADGSAVASVHRRCLTDLLVAEGLR